MSLCQGLTVLTDLLAMLAIFNTYCFTAEITLSLALDHNC